MTALKLIPIGIAITYLLNTVLSYFYIELSALSLIGGASVLPLLFIYIASFAFNFCVYHRMFIYYVAVSDLISYLDYWFDGLPITNKAYLLLHLSIAGIFLFLILYLKFTICKQRRD